MVGGGGRVVNGSRGGDLRRVVDGASLVLLETLKNLFDSYSSDQSSSFRSGSQNQHEEGRTLKLLKTPTVFPQKNTLKGIVLSVTDLVGITSGTIHQHPSNPSPPPPSSSNPSNSSSSSSSSSVVYFLHDEDEKEEHSTILLGRNSTSFGPHSVTNIAIDDDVADEQLFLDDSQNQEKQQQQATHFPPSVHKESSTVQPRRPRERRVPSTPIGRALGFASLGAGLAWGTVQESARRLVYGSQTDNEMDRNSKISPFLSEQNAERLALALCRMRGAALKLGQMLSIQDESLIPAPILSALDIVRQGADVMPRSQLNDVLDAELGLHWSTKLKSFDYEPLAAASIGQVHRAVTKDDMVVAMKIQYPGVADSIDSDIENVKRLLDYTNIIPKGLFLDKAIKVAKEELSRECDYVLEAQSQKRFRELLSTTEGVYVPLVITGISSRRILTTEFVPGIPIDKVVVLNQETRNYIGRKLLEVTLKELFVFRFMQTDPNWSNFLYDEDTKMINLIDFGAAREYRKSFVDDYLRMVLACANRDRNTVIEMSTRLGFLTGMESEIMLDAHVQASFIVGLPFSTSGAYDFRSSNIIGSISHLGATMLRHRLTPPPDEAYSLHRKLSGAFLACIKLGVVAPCRDLLLQVYQQYRFSDENEEISALS